MQWIKKVIKSLKKLEKIPSTSYHTYIDMKIKYMRLKKPKKDEMIVFILPEHATQEQLEVFRDQLKQAQEKSGPMIVMGNVKITSTKKGNVKVKKNGRI